MAEFQLSSVLDLPPPVDEGLPVRGPWHVAADFILCLLPILFLVVVTLVKRLMLPTAVSLPVSALMMLLIRLAYLSAPPNFIMASLLSGFLEVLTPLSIIFGAILLFQTMHHTKCLAWIMGKIKELSGGHPVAEVYLISWAFAYLVEGASGFGTPVALGAPMLASLGHDPFNTVVCGLIMNALSTQFGAVGTPIWFGFGILGVEVSELERTGFTTSVIVGVCAYVIPIMASSFLLTWKEILHNLVFILISITSCVVPAVAISLFSYEFPTIVGGLVGVVLTGLAAKYKVGLTKNPGPTTEAKEKKQMEMKLAASVALSEASRGSIPVEDPVALRRKSSYQQIVPGLEDSPYHPTLDFPITNDPLNDGVLRRRRLKEKLFPDLLELEHELQNSRASRASTIFATPKPSTILESDLESGEMEADEAGTKTPVPQAGGTGQSPVPRASGTGQSPVPQAGGAGQSPVPKDAGTGQSSGKAGEAVTPLTAVLRTFPLWATILVLIITRIPHLRIKPALQAQEPAFTWRLGTLAHFRLSAALVFQVRFLLTEAQVNWRYEFFYIPFFLPFVVVSLITIAIYRRDYDARDRWWQPFAEAADRVSGVVVALTGALCLVQLIRNGGNSSPAFVLGYWMSKWLGKGFIAFSFPLGALGAFFSGSTTVSNLTFGQVNQVAALASGIPVPALLALQTAGATAGNSICINNILSAQAVLGLMHISVGDFIKRTTLPTLIFYVLATLVGLFFTLL